jgi:uncharacterized membrane protein YkvA (DUF1232 family)
MLGAQIAEHIERVLAAPDSRGPIERRIDEIAAAGWSADQRSGFVDHLAQFVRSTGSLIDAASGEATALGIEAYVAPLLVQAANYFVVPIDLIPDAHGLYGLIDDAYLAQRYLVGVSAAHQQITGTALLGLQLEAATAVARGVIGEPLASQLDHAVAADVQTIVNQSISDQTATNQSITGGPGSWGGSWEDEMSRMGAECGISINW